MIVTVPGAHGSTVSLSFDSMANAAIAQQLADAITSGVNALSITPTDQNPPPFLAPGETGEFVMTVSGAVFLPPGYKAVVDAAPNALIIGSGDQDESVMASTGRLTFIADGGSGTVVGGGGDSRILIPSFDAGSWSVNLGRGNDQVFALGTGHDTISAGPGTNLIDLHQPLSGSASVGNTTLTGANDLLFTKHQGAGSTLVEGFQHGVDQIDLAGYSQRDAAAAVATQTHAGGATTIHLTDHVTITFLDVRHIGAGDIKTS